MTELNRPLRIWEKLAYGAGNFFPTAVTATGGMVMFFYTDVVGLSAALIGTLLLCVRFVDAVWDIAIGRWVDHSRGRFGQCRTFLLWAPVLMVVAFIAAFTVPPFEGTGAKVAFVLLAYSLLWWAHGLVHIPFQSMPALVAPDPDERLRLLGVNSLLMFVCVIACGAGFPMLKDKLGGGDQALGFQRAAMLYAAVGLLLTWITFAFVRERVKPVLGPKSNVRADLRALAASRAWRSCMVGFALLSLLVGLPLSAGVYYFSAVLKAPQLIGPFMGLSGAGLMLGVITSDRLSRRFCKRKILIASSLMLGVASLGYLLVMRGPVPAVLVLAVLTNWLLGIGAPISQSMLSDTADAVERDSKHRVVGTLFATVGFGQKIGAGAASAILGIMLSATGYVAGGSSQPESALWGIAAMMGPVNAAIAFAMAAVFAFWYPYGAADLRRIRDDLAVQRQAAIAAATSQLRAA